MVKSAQKSKKEKKKKQAENVSVVTESDETKRTKADNDDDKQMEGNLFEANGNNEISDKPAVTAGKKSKKKKKDKKDFDFDDDSGEDENIKPAKKPENVEKKVELETEPDETGAMKTAAQKRAEKKEREKKKKEAEKAKAKAKSKKEEFKEGTSVDYKTEEGTAETKLSAGKEDESVTASNVSGTKIIENTYLLKIIFACLKHEYMGGSLFAVTLWSVS